MRWSSYSSLASLAFLCVTRAQTTTSTPKSSNTIAATAATHIIKVGVDSNAFDPVSVNASVGDTITFQFIASGHSVVQSYFQQRRSLSPLVWFMLIKVEACIPYDTYTPGHPTFFSGFQNFKGTPDIVSPRPTSHTKRTTKPNTNLLQQQFPTWNLTINTTDPTYYYCSKTDSCLKEHMIGVINPNSTWTFSAQNASIDTAKIMLQPGQPIPAEGSSTSTSHASSLSSAAIAGIAVAAAVVVALSCAILWLLKRQKRLKKLKAHQSNDTVERWVDGTHASGSLSGARPPSYAFDMPAQMTTMDMQKDWEGQQGYAYQYQAPAVHELGVADPVELDDDSRGRTRTRDGQQ